uniref:Major facilitator superfamily (MFS) profile domain-containing protein n=1 Tax=Ditylenchus dipsaci TaxID=166011 RepID=A0A915EIF3_9BILA
MEMETNSDDQCVGKSYGNHTHATCKEDIEVRKLRMQMPELARQGMLSASRQIFSSLIEQASDKVKAKMIQKNVSDMVYYHRKTQKWWRDGGIRYEGIGDTVQIREPDDARPIKPITVGGISGDTFTVDDAVEYLGFGKFQLMLSLFTGLAWMADAMEMMILSILSPALLCEWHISTVEQAMITTCVFSGMMMSSTVWGKVCDRFGRRTGLMHRYWGVPQSVTLYAEFLPMAQRAKCVVLIESFWAVGAAFESLLALFIMETWGWRWLLLFSSLPLLLFAISCCWLPESARFLMASGRTKEAYQTLQRVARQNGKTMPKGKLVENSTCNPEHRGNISTYLYLTYSKLPFCYGLFGHQPRNGTLGDCKPLLQNDYIDLLSTTMSEFPGLIITASIIEWLGRKKTMALEFGVYSCFMFLLMFCLERRWVTTFIFVARAFISGAFQCVYVYTPEVYPTTLRAIGLGASSSMARLGAIITPFVAQVASGHSLMIPISIYGVTSLLGLIAALSLPIETKGRQMKESH